MIGIERKAKGRWAQWLIRWSQIAVSAAVLQWLCPDPGSAQDDLSRARTALSRRDFKAALAVLQEVVKQNPASGEAHYLLGLALKGVGRPDEALGEFQEAVRVKPKYAEAQMEIGLLELEKGQYAEAEAIFRKGLAQRFKPEAPLYYGLGLVKAATDSLSAASIWLTRATVKDPNKGAYHKALGDVYARQGV